MRTKLDFRKIVLREHNLTGLLGFLWDDNVFIVTNRTSVSYGMYFPGLPLNLSGYEAYMYNLTHASLRNEPVYFAESLKWWEKFDSNHELSDLVYGMVTFKIRDGNELKNLLDSKGISTHTWKGTNFSEETKPQRNHGSGWVLKWKRGKIETILNKEVFPPNICSIFEHPYFELSPVLTNDPEDSFIPLSTEEELTQKEEEEELSLEV